MESTKDYPAVLFSRTGLGYRTPVVWFLLFQALMFSPSFGDTNEPPQISKIAGRTYFASCNPISMEAIAFTIGDKETPPELLIVGASSSNPSLIPEQNIIFGGSGTNRTVTVEPAPGRAGTALIMITVFDSQGGVSSTQFLVNITHAGALRLISSVPDLVVEEGATTAPIPFAVGEVDAVIGVVSSDPALLPLANLRLGGAGQNRFLTFTAKPQVTGTGFLTLQARSGNFTDCSTFRITVVPQTDSPRFERIDDQTGLKNETLGPIPIIISGFTASDSAQLSATSSNPALVPVEGIQFSANSVRITPATNQFGRTTLTLVASDSKGRSASTSFEVLIVNNTRPTIRGGSNFSGQDYRTGLGTAITVVFLVNDAEDGPVPLLVNAISSNPSLIPNMLPNIFLSGTRTSRFVTLVPPASQSGISTITLAVTDREGAIASTNFTLEVSGQGCLFPPIIKDIPDQRMDEDDPALVIPLTVVGDCLSRREDQLMITVASTNPQLIPAERFLVFDLSSVKVLTLQPLRDQHGVTFITLTVRGPRSDQTSSTRFQLTVDPVNDPPLAVPLFISVLKNSPQPIPFPSHDVDGDPLSYRIVEGPKNGTLLRQPPDWIYVPNTNTVGADSFTYSVSDGTGESTPAIVEIVVSESPLLYLNRPVLTGAGQMTFEVAAPAGFDYWIESSSDLRTWTSFPFSTVSSSRRLIHVPAQAIDGTFFRAGLRD